MQNGVSCRLVLTGISGKDLNHKITLKPHESMTFGRNEKASYVLDPQDQQLSGLHLELEWDGQGLYVRDRTSTNGTDINGCPCEPEKWTSLRNDDKIRLGSTVYKVSLGAIAPASFPGTANVAPMDAVIKPKKSPLVPILITLLVLLIGAAAFYLTYHNYQYTTCGMPQKCTICGRTNDEIKPHNMAEATCAAPKTCSDCGVTEGEPLGHDWIEGGKCSRCDVTQCDGNNHQMNTATCTAPVTCSVCGYTEGEPDGHRMSEPACTEPAVCTVCGELGEAALGHDWQADGNAVNCSRCDAKLSIEAELVIYDGKGVYVGPLSDVLPEGSHVAVRAIIRNEGAAEITVQIGQRLETFRDGDETVDPQDISIPGGGEKALDDLFAEKLAKHETEQYGYVVVFGNAEVKVDLNLVEVPETSAADIVTVSTDLLVKPVASALGTDETDTEETNPIKHYDSTNAPGDDAKYLPYTADTELAPEDRVILRVTIRNTSDLKLDCESIDLDLEGTQASLGPVTLSKAENSSVFYDFELTENPGEYPAGGELTLVVTVNGAEVPDVPTVQIPDRIPAVYRTAVETGFILVTKEGIQPASFTVDKGLVPAPQEDEYIAVCFRVTTDPVSAVAGLSVDKLSEGGKSGRKWDSATADGELFIALTKTTSEGINAASEVNAEITMKDGIVLTIEAGQFVAPPVTFGAFEQDSNTDNGAEPIDWQKLEDRDGKVLLISKLVLDYRPLHEGKSWPVSWLDTDLCRWLNDDFLKSFTEEEIALLLEAEDQESAEDIRPIDTQAPDITPGNGGADLIEENIFINKLSSPLPVVDSASITTITVSCLSKDEMETFFPSTEERKNIEFSVYAQKQAGNGQHHLWLRNTVDLAYANADVLFSGGNFNTATPGNAYGIRPCIWVSSETYTRLVYEAQHSGQAG